MARVTAPSLVCPVHGHCIVDDSTVWLVFQKADADLEHLLRTSDAPVGALWIVFLHLTKAIDYLHCHPTPIIHRDIKPSNFLLYDGVPVLADFGLASYKENVGYSEATLAYSAPEVLGHTKTWTAKADIYSLGMVLYQMIARAAPFEGDLEDLEQRVISGERPAIPPETHEV